MANTTSIETFLAEALRAIRAGNTMPWATELDGGSGIDIAADKVWSQIDYHGIALLLHKQAALLVDWPQSLLKRIADEARMVALWELTHAKLVSRILAKLDAAEIESVMLKGTALAYSVYDDPAERRRGDSDLLVRAADRGTAIQILKEEGWYRKDDPHGLYFQEGWLNASAGQFVHAIDLHWEPSDRPILQRILTSDQFFRHKRPLARLSESAAMSDPALTMIHCAINQKWHSVYGYFTEEGRIFGPRRLMWSVDFDLLSRQMSAEDWARLTELAGSRGVGPLIAEALRGAREDLHTDLDERVLTELDARPIDPNLAKFLSTSDSLTSFGIDLKAASSWRYRWRLIADRALPPREHLIEKYPGASGWPTILLRARMILGTAGRVAKRLVAR